MNLPAGLTDEECYAVESIDAWITVTEFNLNGNIELCFLDKADKRELVFVYGQRGVTVGPETGKWLAGQITRADNNKVGFVTNTPLFVLNSDGQAAEFLAELL